MVMKIFFGVWAEVLAMLVLYRDPRKPLPSWNYISFVSEMCSMSLK